MCAPNYQPERDPATWNVFTSYLHGLVTELADQYAPDLFWFDCFNVPPGADTRYVHDTIPHARVDQLINTIRTKNSEAVVVVRSGMGATRV